MLGLGLAAGTATGLFLPGGVLVLDVDALDVPLLASCFVGLRMPVPSPGPGVGLPEIALALLSGPLPAACFFSPLSPACTPLGLLPFATTPLAGPAFGCSMTCRMPLGRRNMPWSCSHSKYRFPLTEPSFLPLASASSTPTQSPVWKWVGPKKRIVAMRSSFNSIVWPTESEEAFMAGTHRDRLFERGQSSSVNRLQSG